MRPILKRSTSRRLKYVSAITLLLIIAYSPCYGVDLTFQWSPNPDSDEVAGYKIYYKTGHSGPPYNGVGAIEGNSPIRIPIQEIWHPLYPEYTLRNLDDDKPLRFVITAYDVYGFESEYSNELCYNCDLAYGPSTNTGPSDDDGASGCFIATAAYGSPIELHVMILKDFRDQVLIGNRVGAKFINLYYRYSPPIADIIKDNNVLKVSIRLLLLPLVGISWLILKLGILPFCLLTCLCTYGFMYFVRLKQ